MCYYKKTTFHLDAYQGKRPAWTRLPGRALRLDAYQGERYRAVTVAKRHPVASVRVLGHRQKAKGQETLRKRAPCVVSGFLPHVSGGTGFGALVVGVTSGRFALSPSASFSVRGERGFFVVRDTASFLGATGGRFGINNETTLGGGLFWERVNLSAGLSLAGFSLPICGPSLCGQMRGLAPGVSVRLDLFGPLPPLLLALVLLVMGCSTVSPDECFPNTSGGFGGSGTIPIGAGVGATGDYADPPRGPLDNGGAPDNPCVTSNDDTAPTPPEEMDTYIRCLGMDAMTCEAMCFNIGATCSALALNPQRPELGVGKLKQCQARPPGPGSTCTYCFLGGSISCSQIKAFGRPIWWLCSFTGGKGCE